MAMLDVSYQHIPRGWWCIARQEHHFQIAELKDPLYHSFLNLCSKKVKTFLLELKSELLYIHCAFVNFLSSSWRLTSGDMESPLLSSDQVTYRDDNNTVHLLTHSSQTEYVLWQAAHQNQLLPWRTFTFSLSWLNQVAQQEHHFQVAELKDPLYNSCFLTCSKCKNTFLLEVKSELLYIHCPFVKFLWSIWR